MSDMFRMISTMTRRLLGLPPLRYEQLLAKRGHFGTRQFHRHDINFPRSGYLEFGEHKLPLVNLSQGGACMAADAAPFANLLKSAGRFRARLSLLGISRIMTFSVAYLYGHQVGVRFEDLSSKDQQFLNITLKFLDYGLVLESVSKQEVEPPFRSPSWNTYGLEDLGVLVQLNINLQGVLQEAQVSYQKFLRKELVHFGREGITIAVNPRRKLSVFERKRILRNALLILIGIRQINETDRFDSMISSGIGSLYKKDRRMPAKRAAVS